MRTKFVPQIKHGGKRPPRAPLNDVQIASTFGDNGQQLPEIPTTTFWISHAVNAMSRHFLWFLE
jgi:hypothetical protein